MVEVTEMTIRTEDFLNSILESLSRIDYIKPGDLPNIDLYMDQLTTFMDENLNSTKRFDSDKILTKTMINNYAKNRLLPPPVRKKYSKEHILVLIFIYYFKNILSISDIQSLLDPIVERYFHKKGGISLEAVYSEVFSLEAAQVQQLQEDVVETYRTAQNTFQDANEEDRQFLQMFAFVCMLSFDVYVKKQMIEKIIDSFPKGLPGDKKTPEKHKK